MAYRILPVYNIDKSVGQGGVNLPQDVTLIQLMLNELAQRKAGWAPATPLPVNGLYTPVLRDWILAYQTSVVQAGYPMARDGRVDPMSVSNNVDWSAGPANAWGTMFALNSSMRKYARPVHEGLEGRLGLTERC